MPTRAELEDELTRLQDMMERLRAELYRVEDELSLRHEESDRCKFDVTCEIHGPLPF